MKRRDFIKLGAAVGAIAGRPATLPAAARQQPGATTETYRSRGGRDLAIVNAKIVTMEPGEPEAEAALVRGGRLVLVGDSNEVRSQAGRVQIFDAAGRTVVPGFIDAHTHVEVACVAETYQAKVHTPPLGSLREVIDVLRSKTAETSAGEWVIARGSFALERRVSEGRLLTRQDLDAVTEDHPLIVFSGRHVAMLNTKAILTMGLWDPDSTPPRGAIVHRDASGVPTGTATELYYLLPSYSIEQVKAATRKHVGPMFVANGTTSVYTVPYSTSDITADLELQAAGELPLRVRMYYHVPHMISLQGLLDTGLVSGFGDEMFRLGGVKLFVDGLGGNGLGDPLEDYKWTQEELDDVVFQAHTSGLQVLMHVITPGAIHRAATAVEKAFRRDPRPHRHRLEHGGSVETVEEMRWLRDLGLRLVVTPSRGRPGRRTPRYRTLVREGLEIIGITDTTGTVPGSSAPLPKIAAAMVSVDDGGGAPAGETLTFDEALRLYTLWAARGGLEEADKGSIAVGKLGDFAVLSDDPRSLAGEDLFGVQVEATILGGEVVFER